jgi:aminoglycoside 6'-N-acetyltransferase
MRHEGTSFEQEWEPGGWINLELHGIDREEWSARASGSPAPREHSPNPVPPAVPSEIPPAHFEIPYDFAVLAVVPMPTERLEIRCYRDADASDLHSLMGDPEVTRFLPRGPMSMTEALGVAVQNAQNTALANDGDVVKLVLEFEGRFAGQAKLELASIEDHVLEIGWTLAPEFQGRGIATEAATALLDLAVHTIGTHRVIAHIYPDNHPSAALATRLGMRLERLSRSDWPETDGNWTDTAVYAITAAEWRARSLPE